jgi:osmotically-inducible protein OsmY
MKTGAYVLATAVLLAGLNACVIVVDEGEGDVDATWASSYSSTDEDSELARRIGHRLEADPALEKEDLHVQVRRGVVTLKGEVADIQTLDRAVQTAAGVEGVRRVVSKLTVEVSPS